MSEIADKVKKIVVDQLGVNEDQVTDDAKFIEDLGADSLDQVELVMALEEAFLMRMLRNLQRLAMPSNTLKASRIKADQVFKVYDGSYRSQG